MTKSRIVNNAKWIVLCRIVQALMQLVIGMLTARYLGPANYGLIGYAGSIIAFALPLTQLGLQATLIQELTEAPENEGKIMGTAMGLDFLSGLVCIDLTSLFVGVVNHGEMETRIVCALCSISLLFRAMELMQCWYQYKLASKYPSIVSVATYVVVSAYKIYLLATGKSIYWFAVVSSIEYALLGIALVLLYGRLGGKRLSFDGRLVGKMLGRSRYYILSAMMVTIFQNTDHIMLKMYLGDVENGYYTAAVTSAGVCLFVYSAIVDSFRPVILANKHEGSPAYERNIVRLYSVTTYMALAQGAAFTLLADVIISILYGAEYMAAAPVLRIYVWLIGFSYMGSVRNIWILAEGKQKIIWRLNLSGALVNVALNALMIPRWGAQGAALASLATQVFTNFVLGFLLRELRDNNRLLIRSLDPRSLMEVVRHGRQ